MGCVASRSRSSFCRTLSDFICWDTVLGLLCPAVAVRDGDSGSPQWSPLALPAVLGLAAARDKANAFSPGSFLWLNLYAEELIPKTLIGPEVGVEGVLGRKTFSSSSLLRTKAFRKGLLLLLLLPTDDDGEFRNDVVHDLIKPGLG